MLTGQIMDVPETTAVDQLRRVIAPWNRRHAQRKNFLYKQFRAS